MTNCIKATEEGSFGASKIKLKNRQELAKQCSEHIERLLKELDRCFAPSPIQENMSVYYSILIILSHTRMALILPSMDDHRWIFFEISTGISMDLIEMLVILNGNR